MTLKNTLLLPLPGNEEFSERLASLHALEIGEITVRQFPDGETYVRVISEVKDKDVALVCSLSRLDEKLLPLYFLAKAVKEQGSRSIHLIAPYLAYMRQDIQFNPGEAVTSKYFAQLLSGFVDSIATIDPHLHRYSALKEIYSIPATVAHAAGSIAEWIKANIKSPVLIGPDSESKQWVAEVAAGADAPFVVLEKTRHGDRNVEVSIPRLEQFPNHTPVLVDDIISTARTMIETLNHLKRAEMKQAICIGVHAVFAGNAYQELLQAGAAQVVTCNTIPHESNGIDISKLITGPRTDARC